MLPVVRSEITCSSVKPGSPARLGAIVAHVWLGYGEVTGMAPP